MKNIITGLWLLVVVTCSLNAQFTAISNSYWFKDEHGALAVNGSLMILCDTNGDGFSAQNGILPSGQIATGSYLGNSDDVILGWGNINTYGKAYVTGQILLGNNGVVFGKNIGLLWFSHVNTSDTCLLGNETYGFYRPNNTPGWYVFHEGAAMNYDATGIFGGSSMHNTSSVPEPHIFALAMGGLVLAVSCVVRHSKLNRKG